MIARTDITGVILAGGRGSRMGGVDKGLQQFNGTPLVNTALERLQPQVGAVMINANRNIVEYESLGIAVWPDSVPGYAGPLAGFLAALEHCKTPWLVTVPCDTPLFPLDLVARLADAAHEQGAVIAMASAREDDGPARTQPVFCLMQTALLDSLAAFVQGGGRKIDKWTALHKTVVVPFDQPGDAPRAFFNANTLDELRALEQR